MIFSCLIKKSKLKAIEIETAFFNPLENPKGRTLDYFFYASYISKKSLKVINENSTSPFNYWDNFTEVFLQSCNSMLINVKLL